jgi:hypothetical protein
MHAGLYVVPNAREVLTSLYEKTIRTAKAFDVTSLTSPSLALAPLRS